jgi:predicted DNA-binding transcriptional regulator YafY
MSSIARDRIRRCLAMIPLIRARPGIRIPELASIFGVRDAEIWEDLTEVLTMCGVPPYLPHNYLVFAIHGDSVSIRFAEHLSRPVHLTLQEALAIDLALRSVSGGRLPAFGDAAPRLRRKLRDLLGGKDRQALAAFDASVAGTPPSDLVTETICLVKEGMGRNVGMRIVYYTASRDEVSERIIEPFGLMDHRGHWYVIANDPGHGAAGHGAAGHGAAGHDGSGAAPQERRVVSFRVDRIRSAVLLPAHEYEVPDDFSTKTFRRDELFTPGPKDIAVKVRFSSAVAGRVREETARKSLQDQPDGQVIKTYHMAPGRPRWLFTHIARYGPHAEILSPPDVRAGMAAFLDSILDLERADVGASEVPDEVDPPAHQVPARTRSAAAVSRTKRAQTKRKPR